MSKHALAEEGEDEASGFCQLELAEVESAEELIGARFPDELRDFFVEVGYGFIESDQAGRTSGDVNRIPDPLSIADMVALGDPEGQAPREGFPDGLLPVLDLGSWLYFTMPVSGGPVYDVDYSTPVADGFEDLIRRMYFDRIDFWRQLREHGDEGVDS